MLTAGVPTGVSRDAGVGIGPVMLYHEYDSFREPA